MNRVLRIVLAVALLSYAMLSFGDTLYTKKGKLVSAGNARIEGEVIHWTPCNGKSSTDYSVNEYEIELGDNCRMPIFARLPATGSSLPLIGVIGLGFLLLGAFLKPLSTTIDRRKYTGRQFHG